MKKSIYILIALLFGIEVVTASCSPREDIESKPVLARLLYQEDLRTFTVPGFLVRYAMLVSEDTRRVRPALKGVNSFTISISEDVKDSRSVFTRINSGLNKRNYINIMEVIDNESRITVKALEHKGRIREMVVLIDDKSSIVCFSMRGRIDPANFLKFVETVTNEKASKRV